MLIGDRKLSYTIHQSMSILHHTYSDNECQDTQKEKKEKELVRERGETHEL